MASTKLAHGLTWKQNAYSQGIAAGLSGIDAYRKAYNAGNMSANAIYREASLLLDDPTIAQRINTLIAEAEALAQLSRGNVATRLDQDREFARDQGNPAAAIKATELRGDIIDAFGKRERRVTAKVTHRVERFRSMDGAQLDEFIDSTYKELTDGVDGDDA